MATASTTGAAIAASTSGDRNRHHSSPTTSSVDSTEIRSTSALIARAASRANTAGPATSSRAEPGVAAWNAAWIAPSAASWPGMSIPPALVRASSSARDPSGENHAPSITRTREASPQDRSNARNAPVGSARPNCAASGAIEDRSCPNSPSSARRSAGSSNAAAVTAGLNA